MKWYRFKPLLPPKNQNTYKKIINEISLKAANAFYEGRQVVLHAFKSRIFPLQSAERIRIPIMLAWPFSYLAHVTEVSDRVYLKISTLKKIVSRLPTALA